VLKKRDRDNSFHELWSTVVDPNSRFVNRADPPKAGTVWTLFESGPPAQKVDILLISEGYTAAQMPKFHADAKRLVDALFAVEPFKSRKSEFNVRGLNLVSHGRASTGPVGSFRRTPIGQCNIFVPALRADARQRAFRDAAASALRNSSDSVNETATQRRAFSTTRRRPRWIPALNACYPEFGHHFAGLADEYYTSDVAYETGGTDHPEPWEPNVTALHDPSRLKWRDLVEPGTPLPTPWDKAAYETKSREVQARRRELRAKNVPEAEIDAHFRAQMEWDSKFLSSMSMPSRRIRKVSYEAKASRPESRLHHVHPRPGQLLPRVPPGLRRIIDHCAR
jgi:hypothetical protein